MKIDLSSPFGQYAARRLVQDKLIWLTTVGAATGTPTPNPVWFLWTESGFIVRSQPNTPKLRNIARSPRVSLNFETDRGGDGVVVVTGEARVDSDGWTGPERSAFLAKYRSGISSLQLTPEGFAASYSVTIRIVADGIRGWI